MPEQRNPIAVQFGRNLARVRKQAGHSQEALAVMASLHRTEIGLLERGERMPRIDTAIKLASALGIEADELVKGIEWTPGSLGRIAQHAEAMKLAAEARKGQSEQTDAAALIREVRDEMEER